MPLILNLFWEASEGLEAISLSHLGSPHLCLLITWPTGLVSSTQGEVYLPCGENRGNILKNLSLVTEF